MHITFAFAFTSSSSSSDSAVEFSQIAHDLEKAICIAHRVQQSHAQRHTPAGKARVLHREDGTVLEHNVQRRIKRRQQRVSAVGQIVNLQTTLGVFNKRSVTARLQQQRTGSKVCDDSIAAAAAAACRWHRTGSGSTTAQSAREIRVIVEQPLEGALQQRDGNNKGMLTLTPFGLLLIGKYNSNGDERCNQVVERAKTQRLCWW